MPSSTAPVSLARVAAPLLPRHGPTRPAAVPALRRLAGLDGIRGLAAVFVVVNHIFLRAFPGYPVDNAPWWAGWFIYGRFAVVVFIVLSGFSLGVSPARHGWRLDGLARYARRRAWRILPPYWAALLFSLLMTWLVVAQPGWPEPNGKSFVVNGLLVQDVFGVPSPNRAFWSIAIEAQLYVLLPLLLLLARRVGAVAMATTVTLLIATLGVLGERNPSIGALVTQYTPDMAALFAIGVLAAGVVNAKQRIRYWLWPWLALGTGLPVVILVAVRGSVWTIDNLFWVDLALGPVIACLLVSISLGRPATIVRVLDARPLRGLGSISYSLYLTHAPIVIAIYFGLLESRLRPGVPTFLVMIAVVLPVTILFARWFAAVFEIPFRQSRSWPWGQASAGMVSSAAAKRASETSSSTMVPAR